MEYSEILPATFLPALEQVNKAASVNKRRELRKTLVMFGKWCVEERGEVVLDRESILGFRAFLRKERLPYEVRIRNRHLYDIGILGQDMATRDWLHANHLDRRATETIPGMAWWPCIPRLLITGLEVPRKRPMVLALDNYFRWRRRTANVTSGARFESLFLAENRTPTAHYEDVAILCRGLNLVLPGNPDHIRLAEMRKQLYREMHAPASTFRLRARRIPEVESLLEDHRNLETGAPIAPATAERLRKTLNLHFDLVRDAGLPFAFDKAGLDIFADHAFRQRDLWLQTRGHGDAAPEPSEPPAGWCDLSVRTHCESIGSFVTDPGLRSKWFTFAQDFGRMARKRGDPKRKERALALQPMDLDDLFVRAEQLLRLRDTATSPQTQWGICTVLGALGIFLFFPLRKADLLRLRIDEHLIRIETGWILAIGDTQKTGEHVSRVALPQEATRFLDACLLQGARRDQLANVYRRRSGKPFLESPNTGVAYEPHSFSRLFKRQVGHPPHDIRSIWCDELVARGADRIHVSVMLQHRSIISQETYEVIAGKIRRLRSLEHLAEVADAATRVVG